MEARWFVCGRIMLAWMAMGWARVSALQAWTSLALVVATVAIGVFTPATTLARDWPVCSADEIGGAIASAQPGDTLTMCNGTWVDESITFEANGTTDQPITLRAESPGQVILTGASRLRIGGSYLTVDGLYFKDGSLEFANVVAVVEFRARASTTNANHCHSCRLTNSVIENYNPSTTSFEYKWVALYGGDNRVDHSTFKGKTNVGSILGVVRRTETGGLDTNAPENHTIDHNDFVDRPPLGVNGGDIITIGESGNSLSDSRTTVEVNLFERCNGEIEIISSKSGGNVFRSNTFVDSQGTLTLRHGNGALVEGNFFFGHNIAGTGGVRIIGEDHVIINNYFTGIAGINSTQDIFRPAVDVFDGLEDSPLFGYFQVKHAVIAFNTLVGNERNIVIGGGRTSLARQFPDHGILPPLDSAIANNAVVKVTHPNTHCFIDVMDEPINMTYEGNIVFGACVGVEPVPGGINIIDPMLVLASDGLYRPASGSPLIDSSVGDYPMVTIDMDGQPRDDGFKDVGADEVSSAPITRRPLTPQDVGASWLLTPSQ